MRFSGPGGTGTIELVLFIPNEVEGPAPGFLMINHRDRSNTDPTRQTIRSFWPAEEIVERGYTAAAFHVSDVAPDAATSFHIGVLRIFDPPGLPRAPDRFMDYADRHWGLDGWVRGHAWFGHASCSLGAVDLLRPLEAVVVSSRSRRLRRRGMGLSSLDKQFRRGKRRIACLHSFRSPDLQ